MAYEELTVHAIQRTDVAAFEHRFRSFPTKSGRDQTLNFLRQNKEAANMEPVTLRVIVETDNLVQGELDLGVGG